MADIVAGEVEDREPTPEERAGGTKRLWEMSDVVDVLEAWEATSTVG
jgi:hypothetical protein